MAHNLKSGDGLSEIEMEIAQDADVKSKQQKKAFTRWCNQKLKLQYVVIEDLQKDFCDGVNLIILVQVLSQKLVGRYSKKPRVHAQRMENADLALNFITKTERIRLVNIGGGDMVGGNMKLILGLIWTLILHYDIMTRFDFDNLPDAEKITPKHAILAFVQSKLPSEKVTNLTTDWNDGIIIAKLVDAMAPGLCPESYIMEPENAFENATTAMELAEEWLDIGQLIEPEDMVHPSVDERSMITYLSQFPKAQLKPGAPIRAGSEPSRIKVYGPGVESGLNTSVAKANFTIDTKNGGVGKASASVHSPNGQIDCSVINNSDGTYSCSYVPETAGQYTVNVMFAGKPAAKSPYCIEVAPGYAITAVKAFGPGLQSDGVQVGDQGDFTIDASQAGKGSTEVTVDGPYWRGSKAQIRDEGNGTYSCCYNPHIVGPHKVIVTFANEDVPGSPFKVNITDPSKVVIRGPAVKAHPPNIPYSTDDDGPESVSIHESLEWTIDCTDAGPGIVQANILDPNQHNTDLDVQQYNKDTHVVHFEPEYTGKHRITVTYSGNEVKQSPVEFTLYDPDKVKVSGPGLNGGKAGDILVVNVDSTKAGAGAITFSAIGPSQGVLDFDDRHDGTAIVTLIPEVAGDYKLHVKFRGEDVPKSPFTIPIIDPTKVHVSGSGVTGHGARVGAPAEVIIDTQEAGNAMVGAEVTSPKGSVCVIDLEPTEDCILEGEYMPTEQGNYTLKVKFAGRNIPSSPFKVPICDPDSITLSGTGLKYAIKSEDNIIAVTTTGVGSNEIGCNMRSLEHSAPPVDTEVVSLNDSQHEIHFTPQAVGVVEANVTYCGFSVHNKKSIPVCDPSAVRVEGSGVESGGMVGQPCRFIVDATEAAPQGSGIPHTIEVLDRDGRNVHLKVVEIEPDVWQAEYMPERAGSHRVTVKYANRNVCGSPFQVSIYDPRAVEAYGPGLERAFAQEKSHFTVDSSGAGDGAINFQIEGPADCAIDARQLGNEKLEVVYIAPCPGNYHVHIKFNNREISGSPFRVPCERPPPDASKCTISGVNNPGGFRVCGKNAGGTGLLEVGVCGQYVPCSFISVDHNGDYTFNVSYDVPQSGETTITVKWHGDHIRGSPFIIMM